MKNSLIRFATALGVLVSAATPARPQAGDISVWRVAVESEPGQSLSHYSADLYGHLNQKAASAELGFDNTFEFRNIPNGDYLLILRDANGAAVSREFVSASNSQPAVTIRAPKQEARQVPAGKVSVAELRHPPARKAYRAAMLGLKYARAGAFPEATRQFQKAIANSPDYALAYSGLAASHLRTGDYREAAVEARRAMDLAQPNPADLSTLAIAQFALGQTSNAAETAKRWLATEPENPRAHWVLGLLLARDRRTLAEAGRHLERAAQNIPAARPQWENVRQALGESLSAASAAVGELGP